MRPYIVSYSTKPSSTTTTRRVTIPATSAAIAEAVTKAWLKLQGLSPHSITVEP